MKTDTRVVVVAGASMGLGSALCQAFVTRGDLVVALGRQPALRAVAESLPSLVAKECDLTKAEEVDRAIEEVERAYAIPRVVIYTAHRLELRPSAETSAEVFEAVWRANCYGAYLVASRVLPKMVARGSGVLIFTGATASRRGGPRAAAFSSSKFALRGLAQSLSRELGPKGIHVAHIVLDGLIWSDRTRARFSPEERACMAPEDLAAAFVSVADQPSSAWTHEFDLRPWLEKF